LNPVDCDFTDDTGHGVVKPSSVVKLTTLGSGSGTQNAQKNTAVEGTTSKFQKHKVGGAYRLSTGATSPERGNENPSGGTIGTSGVGAVYEEQGTEGIDSRNYNGVTPSSRPGQLTLQPMRNNQV